jgi:hypothetical protein
LRVLDIGKDMRAHLPFLLLAIEVARGVALAPSHAQVVEREGVLNASYDFVIIGGGTSGLTVADRLTENPDSGWFILGPLKQNTS